MRKATNIAITGGVGCGKSTVADWFGSRGFPVYSADEMGHIVLEAGEVRRELTSRWGDAVYSASGRADRAAIAALVFENPDEMAFLNGVVHRRVATRLEAVCRGEEDGAETRFVEVPLLYECGLERLFDAVIGVWSPECRASRLACRAKFQLAAAEKLERADFGIINAGDRNYLYGQCRALAGALGLKITKAAD